MILTPKIHSHDKIHELVGVMCSEIVGFLNNSYGTQFESISDTDPWLIELEKQDAGVARSVRDHFKNSKSISSIVDSSCLKAIAEDILDMRLQVHDIIRLRTTIKDVDYTASRPHQDLSLWLDDPHEVNMWLPLVDITEDLAPLQLWGDNSIELLPHTENEYGMLQVAPELVKDLHSEYFLLKRGEVLVFGPRQLHSSMPNKTDKVRWSVDVRFKRV